MYNGYLLDTNVLIHHPRLLANTSAYFFIPMIVIEELGRLAKDPYTTGYQARTANRIIEKNLGSYINIIPTYLEGIKSAFENADLADNKIINTALQGHFMLVTDDINMRIKATALNVETVSASRLESVLLGIPEVDVDKVLSPYETIQLTDEQQAELFSKGELQVETSDYTYDMLQTDKKPIPLAHCGNKIYPVKPKVKKVSISKHIKPKNVEQMCFLHALQDDSVKLISCIGAAGTGKTLLALYEALDQVVNGNYNKIYIIANPNHVGGKDKIGFLPGEINSKIAPYVQALYDNLKIIYNNDVPEIFTDLFDSSLVEVIPTDFLRGRTLHNGFIIVDEAQNYNTTEIKTVLTRMSDSSKMVILGDLEQIDEKFAPDASGMFVAASKLRGKSYSRTIKLYHSERGIVAQDAAQL